MEGAGMSAPHEAGLRRASVAIAIAYHHSDGMVAHPPNLHNPTPRLLPCTACAGDARAAVTAYLADRPDCDYGVCCFDQMESLSAERDQLKEALTTVERERDLWRAEWQQITDAAAAIQAVRDRLVEGVEGVRVSHPTHENSDICPLCLGIEWALGSHPMQVQP